MMPLPTHRAKSLRSYNADLRNATVTVDGYETEYGHGWLNE